MNRLNGLENFINNAWYLLSKAVETREGNFRNGVLATNYEGVRNKISQRIVVLRQVTIAQRALVFFTDIRSDKWMEMLHAPRVSWLLWDEQKKLQLRMYGKVRLEVATPATRKIWSKLPLDAKKNYAAKFPPGTRIQGPADGLPDVWNEEIAEIAYQYFGMGISIIDKVQCLHLHPQGHRHAAFEWKNDRWEGSWLVP
ncbi:MAG: pyridoxamine 5'-phosphate oxidase family protein [Chitinophagales bacterium]|nr:pyridoxamine 5'-phosphate oxidase family protein [Chitinophagales bacterium]